VQLPRVVAGDLEGEPNTRLHILAGTDLIRKFERKDSYGLTLPLLTTAAGEKMGKTAGGAVWLSAEKTSPYEFYQYWINVDDRDVPRFLAFFTFLPMEDVRRLGALRDADIRQAKEVLAWEATKLCHGQAEADKARETSRAAFGGGGADLSAMPSTTIPHARLEQGIGILDMLVETNLEPSKGAARRLIQQGGLYVNDLQETSIETVVTTASLKDGMILLRCGKKRYHRIVPD
jgi:tyrosyl-tRNA synthetase